MSDTGVKTSLFIKEWLEMLIIEVMKNNILLSIISFILGVVLQYLRKRIIFVFYKSKKTELCNEWYGYICYNKYNETVISHMRATIKKDIIYDYHINLSDENYHYKGKGNIENGFLCINLKSLPNSIIQETTYHRYDIARLLEAGFCFGLWLSTDTNNKVTCGGSILSKTHMNDEDIKMQMEKNIYKNESFPIISLK